LFGVPENLHKLVMLNLTELLAMIKYFYTVVKVVSEWPVISHHFLLTCKYSKQLPGIFVWLSDEVACKKFIKKQTV